jgi:hypothetical protein
MASKLPLQLGLLSNPGMKAFPILARHFALRAGGTLEDFLLKQLLRPLL